MEKKFRQFAVSLLLILGIANVFAQSGERRDGAFAFYGQQASQDADLGRITHPDEELRRIRDVRDTLPVGTSTVGMMGNNAADEAAAAQRRQGRMTPEERRALRRQINEAGHDIYAPRR